MEVLWATNKAFLLHHLNMPFEEQPLDLLHKLVSMSPTYVARKPGNPGVFNAMIFMLMVIKRCLHLLCKRLFQDRRFHKKLGISV